MKQNKTANYLSLNGKLALSFLAASIMMGCNDSESYDEKPDISPTLPQETTLTPVVAFPQDEGTPAANEVYLSTAATVSASASTLLSRLSNDSWLLKCENETTIAPAITDEFGALWKLTDVQIAACKGATISKNDQTFASLALNAANLGKSMYLDSTGTIGFGSRQDAYLASIGLPQDNTDVALPEVQSPGELPAPAGGKVALQLYDPMGDYAPYDNFSLHLWGTVDQPDGGCSALESANSSWEDKSIIPDDTDEFGPVWYLPVADTESGCFNVIFRNGNNDKLIGSDVKINLSSLGETNSATFMPNDSTQFSSRSEAFEKAGPSTEFVIDTIGAIMLDDQTLVWQGANNAKTVQIMFSNDGQYQTEQKQSGEETVTVVSGMSIVLTETTLTDEQKTKYPHLSQYPAYRLPQLPVGMELSKLLKASLIAIASDDDGIMRSATGIQTAGALDAIYAENASKLAYGPIYHDGKITLRLWAPTASDIALSVYNDDKTLVSTHTLTEDADSGSWSVTLDEELLDGKFYRYQIASFQPREKKAYEFEVTDPYSVSLSTNSTFSQAINLNADSLKPEGWDDLTAPHSQTDDQLSKMVIYEAHVRDFSSLDDSTVNRGKYLAFTEFDSVPVKHLSKLSEAGVTHLHLLPVFDIATINEDPDQVADIDQPFSKLCEVNADVKQSPFKDYCSQDMTIAQVFAELSENDSIENPQVDALNSYVRGVDSYNWGYDPFHYTVPEGSYATDSDGSTRILEFRKMVKAVKEDVGMNLVVDVVYNHTNASGLASEKSVLDKIVPLYYHRLVPDTGNVETSTCCENTAPEHAMFAKLIDDSIQTWTEQYKIDAFRWDLMGHHPLSQMTNTLQAARDINPEVYFYGEGWNFGEVENDKRFKQATQKHLAGTGIGSFSDRLRDAIRGGSPFDSGDGIRRTQGFATGAYVAPNELVQDNLDQDSNNDGVADELARALHQSDLIRLGMAGNLKAFELVDYKGVPKTGVTLDYNGQPAGYADQPWEIQNYVSKHDNQTFWDNNMYKVSEDISLEDRVRMQAVGMSTVLLGQAIPFKHMGGEILRSKSMQRDSYDFGDWYNRVDFTMQDNNWDKGLPAKEKDQANYALIEKVLLTDADPDPIHIEQMFAFYQELLQIRTSTTLLTLPNADEIVARVDFRNTGPKQTPGLIVMTIDNGASQQTDLDPRYDGVVVIINASPEAQTATNFLDGDGQLIELDDFTLIDSHTKVSGEGTIAGNATFADGAFTVPAWSTAVFVTPRGEARGKGLPVSSKADIPPFGPNQAIYIAGGFNSWAADGTLAKYVGNGLYSQNVGLSKNSEFKFTFGHWDTAFGCGNGDCDAGFSKLGMYEFSMDANDISAPIITSKLVADYSETTWFMPGVAGWEHSDEEKMTLESVGVWSMTLPNLVAGTAIEFKFTGGSWGLFEHGSDGIVSDDPRIGGTGNITFTPDADGNYKVSFNILTKEVTVTTL